MKFTVEVLERQPKLRAKIVPTGAIRQTPYRFPQVDTFTVEAHNPSEAKVAAKAALATRLSPELQLISLSVVEPAAPRVQVVVTRKVPAAIED